MTLPTTIEPVYVIDTHALIWYLKEDKKLSQLASMLFEAAERGETQLVGSALTIAELFYADKKHKLFEDFSKTYTDLKAKPYFEFVPFYPDDVLDFSKHEAVPEMHDRIIAGLARRLNIPLITSDPLIMAAGVVRVVW